MSSSVDICNRALTKIGDDTIISLNDPVKRARKCKLLYEGQRDALLRAHPWTFAIKRLELAKLATDPLYEYDSQFSLPSDYLRMIEPDLDGEFYRVEGGKLLCNQSSIKIKYVAKITDAGQFDPHFTEVLVCMMAEELAIILADDYSLKKQMGIDRREALSQARFSNAIESGPVEVYSDDWLNARLSFRGRTNDGTV